MSGLISTLSSGTRFCLKRFWAAVSNEFARSSAMKMTVPVRPRRLARMANPSDKYWKDGERRTMAMAGADRAIFNTREEILNAAQRVAAREGAGNLTIDAVAREAGMSKGGFLYNFPSKEALLKGMLERMLETISGLIDQYRQEFAGAPNATLRAMIKASTFKNEMDPGVAMAVIAASAQDPKLLDPLRRELKRRWQEVKTECEDPQTAALLWAAADGLMFSSLFQVAPFRTDPQSGLLQRLDELAVGVCK